MRDLCDNRRKPFNRGPPLRTALDDLSSPEKVVKKVMPPNDNNVPSTSFALKSTLISQSDEEDTVLSSLGKAKVPYDVAHPPSPKGTKGPNIKRSRKESEVLVPEKNSQSSSSDVEIRLSGVVKGIDNEGTHDTAVMDKNVDDSTSDTGMLYITNLILSIMKSTLACKKYCFDMYFEDTPHKKKVNDGATNKKLWKKAVLNAAENICLVELGKEESDVDSGTDNPDTYSNSCNIGMKEGLHVTSDSETQSDNLPPTHESADPKVNSSGEVKTSRYTKRVKPPLPRRPRKKEGTQQPTRISSKLAEKCKNEVVKTYFIMYFY